MVGNCIELFRAAWLTTTLRFVSMPGDGVLAPVALVALASLLILWVGKGPSFLRSEKKGRTFSNIQGDWLFAMILLSATLFGNLIKYLLKNYYAIPRPEVFGCDVMVSYVDQYAFPSGHTIFYTIFFGLLAYYAIKNWAELWAKFVFLVSVLLIAGIGYSRLYLGAHWYLDVFAGYIIGGTILTISILIYEYYGKGSDPEQPGVARRRVGPSEIAASSSSPPYDEEGGNDASH